MESDRGQTIAAIERLISNARTRPYTFTNSNRVQPTATSECRTADVCYFITNNYFLNGRNTTKPRTNLGAMESNRRKIGAVFERIIADVCNAVGNLNGGQPTATSECRTADVCYTIRNNNGN